MKKLIIFILVFLPLFDLMGQTVFAPLNSTWHFEENIDMGAWGRNYIKFQTTKDTLYNGFYCSKIEGKKIQINTVKKANDTFMLDAMYTYTNGDTVFYFNSYYNKFCPLFIFDVKIGDTVTYYTPKPISTPHDTIFKIRIVNIDTINIDGESLKRIFSIPATFSYYGMDVLIERIGSPDADKIGYRERYGIPEHGIIRCYQDSQIDTNFDYWNRDCEFLQTTSIIDPENNSSDFSLFPNPTSSILSVYSKSYNLSFCFARVYNVLGEIQNCEQYSKNTSLVVNTEQLIPSEYIIKLYNKNNALLRIMRFTKK